MLPAARALLALLVAGLLVLPLAGTASAAPAPAAPGAQSRALPTKAEWKSDVRAIMGSAPDYLIERAAQAEPGELLAINLDIDNTSLQTEYAKGRPVRPTLRMALRAQELGMAVFFNTGRRPYLARIAAAQLAKVGYPVDRMCARRPGETLAHGKQRCRASFVADGYTLVANVGNNPTDFVGGDYERAFRLPNYDGQLG